MDYILPKVYTLDSMRMCFHAIRKYTNDTATFTDVHMLYYIGMLQFMYDTIHYYSVVLVDTIN